MIDFNILFNQAALPVLTGSGAALLTLGIKRIRDNINGDLTLERNASTIARQAKMQSKLREYISRNEIRSILIEGAGAVYYAVKGASPEVIRFDMFNNNDMAKLQEVLPHIDEPEYAHKLAISKRVPETNTKAIKEFNQKGQSWLKDKSKNNTLVDDAMLMQLEALMASNDTSTSLSAPCHISIKSIGEKKGADIVLMSSSKKFREAFKAGFGTENISDFRFSTDSELFNMFVTTRKKIAENNKTKANKSCKHSI